MARHTKVLAVANQKGGVGKSTVTVQGAYLLAEDTFTLKGKIADRKSFKVIVIDFDPQCNATQTLLIRDVDRTIDLEPSETSAAFFGWQEGDDHSISWDLDSPLPKPVPVPPVFDSFYENKISIIPAHKTALAEADAIDLDDALVVAQRIRQFAQDCDADYVLLDTSPQLGVRQIVAMVAADAIICPVNTDNYSKNGLNEFFETYSAVSSSNPNISLCVIPNRVDNKLAVTAQKLHDLQEELEGVITKAYIPSSGSITNAMDAGRPCWRKGTSGNDAAVGKRVREALTEVFNMIGVDAK